MERVFKVKLTTVSDVMLLAETASDCPKGVDVTASHGKYTVDAKSILRIMSLNLSEPITITVSGDRTLGISEISDRFTQWRVTE